MKQLSQKLKNGEMQVIEVPPPQLKKGGILVRNHFSLISSGTELSTVKAARKGYLGKAKDRPQQVKQVINTLKSQGVKNTYRAVMKKLEAYSPLGYSCVGEVIDFAPDVSGIKKGDFVACGGFTACHAEIVSVPRHLCARLKPDTDLKQAAYNTLGAIAMQGVRQADIKLGETCAVIGLGLIGQLISLLLRASGAKVIGIDVDQMAVETAQLHCVDLALNRDSYGIEQAILKFTGGLGCDAVIVAAASQSHDPINFSGAIARKKGTIVIVGDVPTGFNREPHFYRKELAVKMSCSYGPGRYDPVYEEKGLDYPVAYIRWTENRNMMSFQELIYDEKIDVRYLTTHTFKLEKAADAYDLLVSQSEPFLGILIQYNVTQTSIKDKIDIRIPPLSKGPSVAKIGFIGAGSYAQSHLLPNIVNQKNVELIGVMTASGISSRSVADKYGFEFCTRKPEDIIDDTRINTLFIASRHDSHAQFVQQGLRCNKHVFVEKPLCLTMTELEEINKTMSQNANSSTRMQKSLMVGYNRRFSSCSKIIKERIGPGPMSMIYRVNAGYIPPESWIQDQEIGGGRIIGEVCHFVDYLIFINKSLPINVYAQVMRNDETFIDVVSITLSFENGSIGTIVYYSNGDMSLPKERFEVSANGNVFVIDDFKTLSIYTQGKKKVKKLLHQDKGQKEEIKQFLETIQHGGAPLITFKTLYHTSLTTFKIVESIQTGKNLQI